MPFLTIEGRKHHAASVVGTGGEQGCSTNTCCRITRPISADTNKSRDGLVRYACINRSAASVEEHFRHASISRSNRTISDGVVMATFAIKCPHCLRDNTSFNVIASEPHPDEFAGVRFVEAFATCNACHRSVCTTVTVHGPRITHTNLVQYFGVLESSEYVDVGEWLPRAPTPDVPQHLPPAVENAFMQAEQLRLAKFREPSGNAYRRALEAALRAIDCTLTGSLFARIEKLASSGELTPAMCKFAHRIRTLGNEASHETPLVADDEIDNLATFTRLFLLYRFTLPAMLPTQDAR